MTLNCKAKRWACTFYVILPINSENDLQKLGTLKNEKVLIWLIIAENIFLVLTTSSCMLQLILVLTSHTQDPCLEKQTDSEHKLTLFPSTVAKPASGLQPLTSEALLFKSSISFHLFRTLSKLKLLDFWSSFKALTLIKSSALTFLQTELSFRFPPILQQCACSSLRSAEPMGAISSELPGWPYISVSVSLSVPTSSVGVVTIVVIWAPALLRGGARVFGAGLWDHAIWTVNLYGQLWLVEVDSLRWVAGTRTCTHRGDRETCTRGK